MTWNQQRIRACTLKNWWSYKNIHMKCKVFFSVLFTIFQKHYGFYFLRTRHMLWLILIPKIPKTFVLTKMQHNLICESPFMKNQWNRPCVKFTGMDCTRKISQTKYWRWIIELRIILVSIVYKPICATQLGHKKF